MYNTNLVESHLFKKVGFDPHLNNYRQRKVHNSHGGNLIKKINLNN